MPVPHSLYNSIMKYALFDDVEGFLSCFEFGQEAFDEKTTSIDNLATTYHRPESCLQAMNHPATRSCFQQIVNTTSSF